VSIFHLVGRADWPSDPASYRPASLAEAGFIHFSTAGQLLRTADLFYGGWSDLVAVEVDPSRLGADLRWEPPAHPSGGVPGGGVPGGGVPGGGPTDELFPHLYGPIDAAAVVAVHPMVLGADGRFARPPRVP
jgi:uncharacterized protein (DUF952 family)